MKIEDKPADSPVSEFDIELSIPEVLEIKMVNAAVLSDYETWIFIANVLSNAMVGFWIVKIQNTEAEKNNVLFWIAVIFTSLFTIAVTIVFIRRKKLNKKSKMIRLKASKQAEKKEMKGRGHCI